jgi:hypothetical protein
MKINGQETPAIKVPFNGIPSVYWMDTEIYKYYLFPAKIEFRGEELDIIERTIDADTNETKAVRLGKFNENKQFIAITAAKFGKGTPDSSSMEYFSLEDDFVNCPIT